MSKVTVKFKDPDLACHLARAQHPRSDDKRDEFYDKYFEFAEYGRIEIDTKTLEARLLPRADWK